MLQEKLSPTYDAEHEESLVGSYQSLLCHHTYLSSELLYEVEDSLPCRRQLLVMPSRGDAVYYMPGYGGLTPPRVGLSLPDDLRQQQHQSKIRITNPLPAVVVHQPLHHRSYYLHQALACIIMWLVNPPFGLIAFSLAAAAETRKKRATAAAQRLGNASIVASLVGVLLSVVVVVIAAALTSTRRAASTNDGLIGTNRTCLGFVIGDDCYSTRRNVRRDPFCGGTLVSCCRPYEDLYYNDYCYDL